jgi:hypothetical protein
VSSDGLLARSGDVAATAAGLLDELSKAWEDAARVPATADGVLLAQVIQVLDDLADRAETMDAGEAIRIAAVTSRVATLASEAAMVAFFRATELESARAAAELGIDQPNPIVLTDPAAATEVHHGV